MVQLANAEQYLVNRAPRAALLGNLGSLRYSLIILLGALTSAHAESAAPPEICFGHGSLNSIDFTDWESGLGMWSAERHDIPNPETFDTEDWQVVGTLPDFREGMAAYVADLDTGNCSSDNETGALSLTSRRITIPGDALVPRVAFEHWFATEQGWDGGNLKLSVNNGPYLLIPSSAIEFNTYTSRLFSAAEGNSNPLALQPAYTGTRNDIDGIWEQVRVNLYGLAEAGDRIRLQFDFGVDGCDGLVGWYVDDVRIYSCSAELPPSPCGNGILDPGEQCDDANNYIGDGCSNTCQVESDWQCAEPVPPGEVLDPGFEAGTPNPNWSESSTNFGTPICDELECGSGAGTGPASGTYWAWFGGIEVYEESSLKQSVTIPSTSTRLLFELEASTCDSASDYLEVRIDNDLAFRVDGSSALCESIGYTTQMVDVSEYSDGEAHSVEFHAETFGNNLGVTNFFVDDVAVPGVPSVCKDIVFGSSFESTD